MSSSLWEQVSACFCHDDGSLPSIEIGHLTPGGISAIYSMLRSRSQLVGPESFDFWSRTKNESLPIDSVPNAALLVTSGEAEAFHFCIGNMKIANVHLPVLGVFIWSDSVEIDYRMGPDWGAAQVTGFFELLHDCCAVAPEAVVAPASFEGPPYPERFVKAWEWYRANRK